MPVPKKRTSRGKANQRRSHDALKATSNVEICPKCTELKLRHHVCPRCGTYMGRQVVPAIEEES
jgi:large subunit ribosomal protein L32